MGHYRFGVAEPGRLVLALYVRDVAGLRPLTDPVIPALQPEVPARPGLVPDSGRAVVTAQWEQWWRALWARLEDLPEVGPVPEQVPDLGEHPQLQLLVRSVFTEAHAFCAARHREHRDHRWQYNPLDVPEFDVLNQATRRRGLRRPRPVHVRITELPVATAQGWHDRPGHVVVTRPLYRDVETYQRWLRPVVEAMAAPWRCARP